MEIIIILHPTVWDIMEDMDMDLVMAWDITVDMDMAEEEGIVMVAVGITPVMVMVLME